MDGGYKSNEFQCIDLKQKYGLKSCLARDSCAPASYTSAAAGLAPARCCCWTAKKSASALTGVGIMANMPKPPKLLFETKCDDGTWPRGENGDTATGN